MMSFSTCTGRPSRSDSSSASSVPASSGTLSASSSTPDSGDGTPGTPTTTRSTGAPGRPAASTSPSCRAATPVNASAPRSTSWRARTDPWRSHSAPRTNRAPTSMPITKAASGTGSKNTAP
jgi:hypothetical protein